MDTQIAQYTAIRMAKSHQNGAKFLGGPKRDFSDSVDSRDIRVIAACVDTYDSPVSGSNFMTR
ncbi:hypothetical protein PROSTU_00122, partial [Providencia stuartii ATCC 25827]